MESYLSSLPPEERQAAIERINAPLSGEELVMMAGNDRSFTPTLEQYAEIEKYHKNHEISFIEGLGKIAEGGEQVMTDLSNAFGSFIDSPLDSTKKMPSTAVEAFAQGTRNFYGMLAESQNPDSILFGVKDFLNGTGTIEDRYNQYMKALNFNRDSADLVAGKSTLLMDKDMINPEITQAMSYIADPTLFIPFGKIASTGLRAVGLGERLTMAGAKAAAIKNGIIGGTIKWGAGQPLEFLGGAVRNTIDYGLEKGGQAFEATTGISGKEFAQTARMSGIGFSASAIAGHAVPYASTISDAYIAGSSARGFGEALTLLGDTMKKSPFGRGINSWAAESLAQAEKKGIQLSPHAKGLLNVLNAVDPLFGYAGAVVEGSSHGIMIGGALGYVSGGEEGMYHGMGAGMALGGVGGLAGKTVADVTGGTAVARRAVQAKMVIEGHKITNPEKAMFFEGMQKATEARGQDVDLVNGIIAGIDNVAPNFEFHALTPDEFTIEAIRKGYNPETGKFIEFSALETEFGGDRQSKSRAMYILRSVGGDFVGDSKAFLTALKKASAKDSANPNKPASNIPNNLRKYIDVAKTFEKLSKTQQDAILKEIDGQGDVATKLGGKTKLRDHYDALTWSEAWTDSLVKKFETDREGARKDIVDMLAQETKKNGQLTSKGRALTDKLRAEGFLDKEGKLLRERNLLQADMRLGEFAMSKGAVISRESDGKTHMYINLNRMGDETFPHELYHTIMRESPMKKHFTDSVVQKLLGVFDANGNKTRDGEVNLEQTRKFFQKYIDLTSRNDDGTLNVKKADETMKLVNEAIEEYKSVGKNKKISDKARGLLEHYTEEFGAYYFSHWLMGRNRNTLFFGGELKGIEGLVERTKDAFKDFWQSKVSKANPEFDFSRGLNESFNRSEGLGRIASIDYYMRDMLRAASNANKDAFRPDSMTLENLRDFERSNGLRNLTAQGGNRRLNPAERTRQNRALGKEGFKILSGLDKNLRTSKDTIDENGKPVITGRLSEAELDALVKGGIVPRAWADKVNQGYAMLDGTVSNIYSAGYLGFSEQTTDASYPRLYGKDVAFKNRKAVLFDIETKIKADGTFYTLFHNIDLAVVEQRGNHLWQNTDYRNLWNGDRGAMEADFFSYISNASKASTDPKKLDSAALLEKGDGLGAQRRDVLQQMAGMALQTGDAYKHQPIAVIPEGIRHSVTTFNIDGLMMPRVEQGARYDINMGNAHKFIRENWQPDDMRQEKTPVGRVLTHESGFKFTQDSNGKVSAYTSAGAKIGTFGSIREAVNAGKNKYNSVYRNFDSEFKKFYETKTKETKNFEPLEESERQKAISVGDLFELDSVKAFIGKRLVLKHARDEFIFSKAEEALANDDKFREAILKKRQEYAQLIDQKNALFAEEQRLTNEYIDLYDIDPFAEVKKFYDDLGFDYRGTDGKKFTPEQQKQVMDLDAKYVQNKKILSEKKAENQRQRGKIDKQVEAIKKKYKEDGVENFVRYFDDKWHNENGGKKLTEKEIFDEIKTYAENALYRKDYSGLLEALFAKEHDDQIQTGRPIVLVGTHGTTSARMMLTRAFSDARLGDRYGSDAYSSTLGHFMGASSETSSAYARTPRYGYGHITGKDKFRLSDIDHSIESELIKIKNKLNVSDPRNFPTAEARIALEARAQKLQNQKKKLYELYERASDEETKADMSLLQEAGDLYNYLHKNLDSISNEKLMLESARILTILKYFEEKKLYIGHQDTYRLARAVDKTVKKKLNIPFDDTLRGLKPDSTLASTFDDLINHFEYFPNRTPLPMSSVYELRGQPRSTSGIIKLSKASIDRTLPTEREIRSSTQREFAQDDMRYLFSDNVELAKDLGLDEKFNYAKESGMTDMHDQLLNKYLEATTIERIVDDKPYQAFIDHVKDLHNEYDFSEFLEPEVREAYPDQAQFMLQNTPMKVRALMAFDNPYVVVDPRAYEEYFIAPHMVKAIQGGHDGIIFKRFQDGGQMDNIIVSFKGNTDKIMEIDTTFDRNPVPRKDDNGNLIKQNFQPDEIEAPKRIQGIKLDMTKAYDVFRKEYEESTGQAWSQEKFMQRASGWQFFGDENGFVAVRPQRSGFVKLVGMAGDNKSKLRGIQQIQQQGLPIWGMVSKDIKDMAVKRGMREPNMIERTLLKQALNSAALGDAEILGYTSDNGVRLRYPDVGEVVKYMVGSPEYYQKLRSQFGEQVKSKIGFQPDEASQGGRVYNENSKKFKTGFIGKWAEDNKDLLKGFNIEFIDRGGIGGYRNPDAQNVRIRLQDNSVKGKTVDVGHITAQINHRGKNGNATATLSTRLDENYRGKKLSYALYSEMAERLRSMGVRWVDGMIVNRDGIPIKVREKIIGDTRMIGADGSYAKARPISQEEGRRIIQRKQARGGEWEGIDVVNELDFKARYQPAEGGRTYTDEQFRNEFIGKVSSENPELTKNLSIKVLGKNNSFEFYIYDKNGLSDEAIGMISTINKGNSGNGKDNIITQAYLKPEYRGKGFGKLLYSELGERLRSVGIENIEGTVVDLQNRPFSIRASVFGKDSTSRMAGTKDGVTTKLDPNAHYMMAEDEGVIPDIDFDALLKADKETKDAYSKSMSENQRYTKDELSSSFVGRIAKENPQLTRGKIISYSGRNNRFTLTLTDSKTGEEIGSINVLNRKSTESSYINFSDIKEEYRGRGYGTLLYSELAERLRDEGYRTLNGEIVDELGRPFKIRQKVIDQENARIGKEGSDIYGQKINSPLYPEAHYQPTEGSRYEGGDDYYKPKKNIFEYKDEQGLLVRRPYVNNSEITGDKDARGHKSNPADYNIRWDEIGHYPQIRETRELNIWELHNSGLWADDPNKGILLKNPAKSSDNTGYTHAEWFDRYEYDEDKPRVYGRYEMPRYGKDGELIDRGKLSIAARYSDNFDSMAEVYAYKEKLAKKLGVKAEDIDAYYFGANAEQKASLGYGAKDTLPIKFQPAEGFEYIPHNERASELLSIIQGIPHYKEALDSGQLTIDNYKPENFKDYFVLSHAPDTASTVDTPHFKAQGGLGYPLLFKGEGWASVSRGLEKRLNAIGEKNRAKHGSFFAPMALVMSHAQKIKSARNGTDAFVNVIKNLKDKNVITGETLRLALVHGLKNAGVEIRDEAFLPDALWKTKTLFLKDGGAGFKVRAKFVNDVAGAISKNTDALKPKQLANLKQIIPDYEGSDRIRAKYLIPSIFKMFVDPLLKDVKAPNPETGGDVYGFVIFDKPLVESDKSPHASYKYSIRHKDNSPVRVDLLSRPVHTMDMFKTAITKTREVPIVKETVTNYTGQNNFPYGDVKHAQPAEGWRDWQSERTSVGSVIKNTAGYVIMVQKGKFKVYNPYKAMVGIYDNEEQAKRRVQKDEPKR